MQFGRLASARVVDLSLTLSERLPGTWPGHMSFAHHNWNWFAEVEGPTGKTRSAAPYQTNFIVIDEHCGTHFDAPTHFVPPEGSGLPYASELGDETGDRVPVEELMGPAAVVDVRSLAGEGKPGISPFIEPGHVEAWEREHGALREGEVVLFRTGWDRFYVEGEEGRGYMEGALVTGDLPGWPAPSPQCVLYLHERGVKTIGIDAPSIGSAHDGVPVHQEGLSRGMRYVEILTNLGELPARGAFFVFLPLKIAGSSGGPGRAIAFLPG
ncbi:Kynurenine formamidase [Rubrobacter xylanophilus DSM 9941]|uniref:cyclase family protein n=1 Tax=Rubrobacter xylanophilus TaxID=49319 RepID=UPI001C644156|nr:cyclase family protein [Rubrobacter xylanophilus]QYJ16021.1 Kynurenine formamidase [Rubrobacter xylanophilus DSM 9941]